MIKKFIVIIINVIVGVSVVVVGFVTSWSNNNVTL